MWELAHTQSSQICLSRPRVKQSWQPCRASVHSCQTYEQTENRKDAAGSLDLLPLSVVIQTLPKDEKKKYKNTRREKFNSSIINLRFGPKVGQVGLKWDKSGTFSDQTSLIYFLKKSRICSIWCQSDPLCP